MSRSARVVRNVGWNVGSQAAITAANFILIPRLVHGFGVEDYGLYLMMFVAANYLQLFTFGASSATVRFVAERHAAHDGRGVTDAFRHGALLHMGGAAIGGGLLWAVAPWAVTAFFQVPARLQAPGVMVLRSVAAAAVFAVGAQWAQSCVMGFQRFDWSCIVVLLQGLLLPLGIAVLLTFGKGLHAAGIWYVLVNALSFAAALLVLRHIRPVETTHRRGAGLGLREFAACSSGLWLGQIAWIFTNQLDKVFILRSMELSALTLYTVPVGLLQRLQVLPASVSTVLVPVISGVSGENAAEDLRCMYLRATRLLIGTLAPVYLLLFGLMPQFLSVWLGGRFGDDSVWPARLFVTANAVGLLLYTPHAVAVGRNRSWWQSAIVWGQAAASLVLWPILIPRLGILGAALTTLVAQIVPAAFYLRAIHGLLDLPWRRYARESLGPGILASAALAALLYPLHHLAAGWIRLIGLSAAGLALYAAVIWACLPVLDRDFIRAWRQLR